MKDPNAFDNISDVIFDFVEAVTAFMTENGMPTIASVYADDEMESVIDTLVRIPGSGPSDSGTLDLLLPSSRQRRRMSWEHVPVIPVRPDDQKMFIDGVNAGLRSYAADTKTFVPTPIIIRGTPPDYMPTMHFYL